MQPNIKDLSDSEIDSRIEELKTERQARFRVSKERKIFVWATLIAFVLFAYYIIKWGM